MGTRARGRGGERPQPDLERPQTARERKSAIVGSVWGFDRLGFLGLGFTVRVRPPPPSCYSSSSERTKAPVADCPSLSPSCIPHVSSSKSNLRCTDFFLTSAFLWGCDTPYLSMLFCSRCTPGRTRRCKVGLPGRLPHRSSGRCRREGAPREVLAGARAHAEGTLQTALQQTIVWRTGAWRRYACQA